MPNHHRHLQVIIRVSDVVSQCGEIVPSYSIKQQLQEAEGGEERESHGHYTVQMFVGSLARVHSSVSYS